VKIRAIILDTKVIYEGSELLFQNVTGICFLKTVYIICYVVHK